MHVGHYTLQPMFALLGMNFQLHLRLKDRLLIPYRIYATVGLGVSWNANSHSGYYKRAMAVGVQQSIGNCAGLIVSNSGLSRLGHQN